MAKSDKKLPLYECHKLVRALKIKSIVLANPIPCAFIYKGGIQCGYGPDESMHNGTSSELMPALGRHDYKPETPSKLGEEFVGAIIQPVEEGFDSFAVSAAYVRKHQPKVCGYYVVYQDGYESWSPADVFEAGYTLVEESISK